MNNALVLYLRYCRMLHLTLTFKKCASSEGMRKNLSDCTLSLNNVQAYANYTRRDCTKVMVASFILFQYVSFVIDYLTDPGLSYKQRPNSLNEVLLKTFSSKIV